MKNRSNKNILIIILLYATLFFVSCKSDTKISADTEEASPETITPVTITHPETRNMTETVEVNATSSFLLKTYVKANANGYLQAVHAQINSYVNKGEELFTIKTKEAESLGNTINSLDSSLHFEGVLHVKSPGSGYITQLSYQSGDYVQDGEQLATITDTRSFVFLLNLPYELKPYLLQNRQLQLRLPDSTVLNGFIASAMPTVDAASQTQSFIIKVNTDKQIPENLVAKVTLVKYEKVNTVSLPKAAILSDEVLSEFWIMKMIDSVTAVKVPVEKGMESNDQVEILSPQLLSTDRILLTGNYGLPDTAKVTIIENTQ